MDAVKKQLEEAKADYDVGNFSRGSATAKTVVENGDDAQKEKARGLLVAMGIDPVATLVYGVTGFVTVFLILKFLLAGD